MPSTWKIVAIVLLALLIILMVYGCYSCYQSLQPKVYPVGDVAEPLTRYNILFLGDGFRTTDEMNTYRAAVQQLVEGLMAEPPFCHYSERLNFYRIDVKDPTGQISENSCALGTPALDAMNPMPFAGPGTPVTGSKNLVKENLRVARCWTSVVGATGSKKRLWIDKRGLKRAHRIAGQAPSISLVVIVANIHEKIGSGYWDVWPGQIGTVVVGVPQDLDSTTGLWEVSENGKAFFAHELGHGLGLLDEYNYGWRAPLDPGTDRNVWRPQISLPETSTNQAAYPIPWEAALPPGCTTADMVSCCGRVNGTSGVQLCTNANPACVFVPGICQSTTDVCTPPISSWVPSACTIPGTCPTVSDPYKLQVTEDCDSDAGAWEGANYWPVGFYRARLNCRMVESYMHVPFCEGCAIYLRKHLCSYGSVPCVLDYKATMEECPLPTPEFPDPN